MEPKRVIIIMTDDDKGLWSIYDEAGQAIEHDFESEGEACQYARDNDLSRVKMFNTELSEERRKKLYPSPDVSHLIQPKKEIRVYVVNFDIYGDDESDICPEHETFNENLFIKRAEEEGRVYTLKGFQEAFNDEKISDACDYILIKEVIVHD